ncbi:MAG: c-type cytochrome [Steroidobacteraceae bacterium]
MLIGVAKAVFVWSGAYNVAADEPHWRVTERMIETLRVRSVASRSADIAVPELEDEAMIRAGAGNYDAMCAGCHLEPGVTSTEQSRGLYPAPPDFTKRDIDDAAAAFWIIKHGIKMTGMPAWGMSMEDDDIWSLVAFLEKLGELSPDGYRGLVAASGGHRHGGAEEADEHDETDAPPHRH